MALTMLAAITCATSTGFSQRFFRNGGPVAPGPGGVVGLPYMFNDNAGNVWRIYNNGWLQQQGNQPLYSQGAMLTVNGAQPNQPNNQGRLDDKTGELILENMQVNNLTVTRRILFDKDDSMVRYIDIFHNAQNQEQTANLSIQTNLNFGVNAAQFVADPKKKDQNLAWVAQTGAGQSVLEMYAGKGAKIAPTLAWPQGSNTVTANLALVVPAGKDVAIMHLHKAIANQDAGVQYVNTVKEAALLKTIPAAIRKIIVNFPNPQGWIGDVELLRGEMLDVVELRTGDQFRGTLTETAFALQTFYGPVNLPVDNVVGIINVGQFRPRQLVVTSDGQIFGGRLKKETLDLQLSSGQVTQIPLAQVSRVGYRKRAGEPDDWVFTKPMVLMRTGERMLIKPLSANVDVATRYGKLTLKPENMAAISFQNEENGVHEVTLSDGSKFSGLLAADSFAVVLETGAQPVTFPASAVLKFQLTPTLPDVDELAPTIHLLNEDELVGTLTGKLSMETAFDTIAVNATEIRSLTRAKDSVQDVQVVLWDGTSVSGQLQTPDLDCELKCGVTMKVPVALLDEYVQPQPRPSPSMVEKIKAIIVDLNADDWKQRDRATAALIGMGPVASSALKELRAKQPPEAQKAIDIVLQKLEEQRKKDKAAGPASGAGSSGVAPPPIPNLVLPQDAGAVFR